MIRTLRLVVIIILLAETTMASSGAVPMGTVFSQIINLSILVGLIFFTQRKTIAQAFKNKKDDFLKSVNDASASKKAAEDKYAEVSARVDNIQSTFQSQMDDAQKNAQESYTDQLAQAKNEGLRIQSNSQTNLEFEILRQVESLRVEAFKKSAGMAEQNLEKSLSPEQRKAWNAHFSSGQQGAH